MLFRKLRRRIMGNHRFRNRDGGHQFSLNVPPSRKETAMRRRRLVLTGLKWTAGLGVGLWAVTASGNLWEKSFSSSSAYAVGQFELITNGVITAPQVAAVTGLRPDQNITDLDLGELRNQLLTLPQVRQADVERHLPRQLSIRLEERRPTAWLACQKQGLRPFDSRGLLLDAEGVVFPSGVMLNEYTSLPVIHCADLAAVTMGRPVENHLVRRSMELVNLIRAEKWPQPMALEQVHVENRFTIRAQMDTDAVFTFSPENLPRQISRLKAILTKVGTSGLKIATVNLQPERNIPVTFFEAPAPAVTKPAAKPGRRPAASPSSSTPTSTSSQRRGA